MAQKSCRFKGKTFASHDLDHCTAHPIARQNAAFASPLAVPLVLSSKSYRKDFARVEPILVLRIRGPAKGPFSGSTAARPHRQGDGGFRHAGLDRGHGRLAESGRDSRASLNASRAADDAASGRTTAGCSGGYTGGPLSIDFGILEFTWRSIVLLIGLVLIIPAPWAMVWYLRWIIPCLRVPGRPNLGFTGQAMTLVPWYFGALLLLIAVALSDIQWLNDLMFLVEIALYWLFLKWIVANLASNGQPLGFSFSGSFWAYLGWNVLFGISLITIIGWAWVYTAWARWFCRNIEGTRREVIFNGTGLEVLWRFIVALIACSFIIPIPWIYRWMTRWLASQTVLVERGHA
jgi:hypothetical protein